MSLIHPHEAAKRLKKHRSTVYRMIQRGEVEFVDEKIEVSRLRVRWDDGNECLVKSCNQKVDGTSEIKSGS